VPGEFGGEGVSTGNTVDACHALDHACSSTALIYVMHQTKAACVVHMATAMSRIELERSATAIPYGQAVDGIVTPASCAGRVCEVLML